LEERRIKSLSSSLWTGFSGFFFFFFFLILNLSLHV